MKDNVADSILEKINKRVMSVSGRLATQYKGVKPFDQKEIKTEDRLYYYEHLSPMDMEYLVTKYGRETVNEMVFEMESLRRRKHA